MHGQRASWVGIGATLLLGIAIARYALRRDAAVSALATQIERAMKLRAEEIAAPAPSTGRPSAR